MGNVYSKLQNARKLLQESKLNKSGKNKFSNYDYFELSDFLPRINEIFDELKLCSCISYTNDTATLKIFNSENPEEVIVFESPIEDAELKSCQPIQILGAKHSYMRRYLYMSALEIVENCVIEEHTGKEENKPKENKPVKQNNKTSGNGVVEVITEAQLKRLYVLGKGKDAGAIKDLLKVMGFNSAKDVTKDKYTEVCDAITNL